MITVNINEIKAKLSYYVNFAVQNNEKIIICNRNSPVAEIKAITHFKKNKVRLGVCPYKIILPANFNETSDEVINSF